MVQLIIVNATSTRTVGTTGGGLSLGALSAGAVISSAKTSGSTTATAGANIGQQTNVAAGGNLSIGATYTATQVAASSTMSAGSLVNIGVTTSSAIANNSPTVSSYVGDTNSGNSSVGATGNLTVATAANTNASSHFNGSRLESLFWTRVQL